MCHIQHLPPQAEGEGAHTGPLQYEDPYAATPCTPWDWHFIIAAMKGSVRLTSIYITLDEGGVILYIR